MPPSRKDRIKEIVLIAALAAVVITIPLYNHLNSITLIFFVFAFVIQQPLQKTVSILRSSRLWLFPAPYFLWLCLTYFWDVSGGFLIRDIERYAILLFIPSAFAVLPRVSNRLLQRVCLVFTGVTVAICLLCLYKSWNQYNISGDSRLFYYHYLGEQMGLNAIFLSLYCMSSVTWTFYYSWMTRGVSGWVRGIAAVVAVFLMCMIFLLSSKFVLVLSVLTFLVLIVYAGWMRGRLRTSLLIIAVAISVMVFAVRQLPYLNWRFNVTEFKKYSGDEDNQNGIAIRVLMWETALEMIGERPLLGYGIHGARVTLLENYRRKKFELGYSQGYHSHNQYFESALMGGIPALLLLLAILASLLKNGLKNRNVLLLQLLIVFLIQATIESAFEVQQELVFYIFFMYLFAMHPPAALHTKSEKYADNAVF